jgi:hypothetical protein
MQIRCWLSFQFHYFIICIWNKVSVRRQWNKHGGCVTKELLHRWLHIWAQTLRFWLSVAKTFYSFAVMLALYFIGNSWNVYQSTKNSTFIRTFGRTSFLPSLSFLLWAIWAVLWTNGPGLIPTRHGVQHATYYTVDVKNTIPRQYSGEKNDILFLFGYKWT